MGTRNRNYRGASDQTEGTSQHFRKLRKPRSRKDQAVDYQGATEGQRERCLRNNSEAETEKLIQKLNAESQTKIGEITNQQNLAEKEAKKKIYEIENRILTVREEAQAEAIKCNGCAMQIARRRKSPSTRKG